MKRIRNDDLCGFEQCERVFIADIECSSLCHALLYLSRRRQTALKPAQIYENADGIAPVRNSLHLCPFA